LESIYNHGHASAFASTGEATPAEQRGAAADTIGAQIQTIAALLNRNVRNVLRSEELSAAQWKVLRLIEKTGPASVDALAAALETGQSGIATLANQLVNLGYIGVNQTGCLELSPVGQAVIQRIERTVRMQQDWLSIAVDPQDLATFRDVCRTLSSILKDGPAHQANAVMAKSGKSDAARV